MFTCILCRYDVYFDDAITPTSTGKCVCLGCYLRAVYETVPHLNDKARKDAILAAGEIAKGAAI